MDIAGLLESHRKHMLDLFESDDHTNGAYAVAAAAHDRATTKTLLDLFRQGVAQNGELKPRGEAALTEAPPAPSRRIKPGSKRARDRAAKAKQTRLANLEAKRRDADAAAVPQPDRGPEPEGDVA